MDNKISVVIHTYNNETILRDCLDTVKDFDEILICDMYSTDKTLEIAKEYNCKIVMHENVGYADPARNFAVHSASYNWVLVVDTDERITKELKDYLYEFIKNPKNITGIKIPRKNLFMGKYMELLYPDYILRFFKKDVSFWPSSVHSVPQLSEGEILFIDKKKSELAIIHKNDDSIEKLINVVNRYTDLEVEKYIEKNKKINFAFQTFKSFWLIFEKFFLKKGYKDGVRGFIFSVIFYGFYKFTLAAKYLNYLEKHKDEK